MNKSAALTCMTLLVLTAFSGAMAMAGGRPFATMLTGDAEVPGPGDPDGSGEAFITLNPGVKEVCFQLSVSDIEPATAAHIHEGPEGVAGPVVIGLIPPTDGFSSGCVSADRDLIRDIIRNPEGFYVNVHNAEFPPGAVRGQLSKNPVLMQGR